MQKIAIITDSTRPNLTPDDSRLVKPFLDTGYKLEAVPWDDPRVPWQNDADIIFRSCWNYPNLYDRFCEFLRKASQQEVSIWNLPKTLLWNAHKSYLLDLKTAGFDIIPTITITKETPPVLIAQHLEENEWEKLIIKPMVGNFGKEVRLFKAKDKETIYKYILQEKSKSGLLIQKYISSVKTEGEYSLIFFNKVFSHAVKRFPKRELIDASPQMIVIAKKMLQYIKSPLLYARVDMVIDDEIILLMELELIEPELFFDFSKTAANQFVDAFISLKDSGLYGV